MPFDIIPLLESYGPFLAYLILFVVIFAETGLLIGFFLPGDSLLFTAGLLASQDFFDIIPLVILLFFAAVIGDSTGYYIGEKFGKRLFRREDSILFHKDHLRRAKEFYDHHGGKTIILARFMPIIRTFAPVVAGMADMKYTKFLSYNIIGAFLWAVCIPLLGYVLGERLGEDIDRYLLPIIGLIVFISIAPALFEAVKTKERRQKIYHKARSLRRRKSSTS